MSDLTGQFGPAGGTGGKWSVGGGEPPGFSDAILNLQQRLDAIGRASETAAYPMISESPAFLRAVIARRTNRLLLHLGVPAMVAVVALLAWYIYTLAAKMPEAQTHDGARPASAVSGGDIPGYPSLRTMKSINNSAGGGVQESKDGSGEVRLPGIPTDAAGVAGPRAGDVMKSPSGAP